jgi:type IV secretion system protein VirB5
MIMKTAFPALVLAAAVVASVPANATGIPTFDAATVIQLQQQYMQLQQQYQTLKQQYSAVTGSYGRGNIGLSDSISSSSVVPGSWQEVVSQQGKGAFGTKQDYYEKLIKTMPDELFQNPHAQNATTYKLSTNSVRAAMAGGDVLYAQVQTHLNNLARLSQQVDRTANIKDAQDLQNRIATENGMLQTALAKVNSLNMNLQANLVNQQNQAISANQQYYQWRK